MYEYDEDCLKAFLMNQSQLFDEPVADNLEEAEAEKEKLAEALKPIMA